jgi:hypothetical protein
MKPDSLDTYFTSRKRISRLLPDGSHLSFSAPVDWTEEQIQEFIKGFEDYRKKVKSGEIKEITEEL